MFMVLWGTKATFCTILRMLTATLKYCGALKTTICYQLLTCVA